MSTSGFTKPAIQKLRSEAHYIDGVTLRPAISGELPLEWVQPTVVLPDRELVSYRLSNLVYVDAASEKAMLMLLYAQVALSYRGLMTFTLPVRSQVADGFKPLIIPRFYADEGGVPGGFALNLPVDQQYEVWKPEHKVSD